MLAWCHHVDRVLSSFFDTLKVRHRTYAISLFAASNRLSHVFQESIHANGRPGCFPLSSRLHNPASPSQDEETLSSGRRSPGEGTPPCVHSRPH